MRRALIALLFLSGCYDDHGPTADAGQPDTWRPSDAGACTAGSWCDCRAADVVPAGAYWMGIGPVPEAEGPLPVGWLGLDNRPAHQVILTRGVWLARFEGTSGCFQRCVEAGTCDPEDVYVPQSLWELEERWPSPPDYWRDPAFDVLPVAALTHSGAEQYCAFLGGRLPTSAEWESAVRGVGGRSRPWDPDPDEPSDWFAPSTSDCGRFHDPPLFATNPCVTVSAPFAPVGSYLTGIGLYGHFDLIGNVAEWVADGLGDGYPSACVTDPLGPTDGPWIVRGTYLEGVTIVAGEDRYPPPDYVADWRMITGVRCAWDDEPGPMLP